MPQGIVELGNACSESVLETLQPVSHQDACSWENGYGRAVSFVEAVEQPYLDAQLSPLLAPLEQALQIQGPVIALCLWQTLPEAALLLPHLHLRWPDRIEHLPLVFTSTLLPCTGADQRHLSMPAYVPADAYWARVAARWYRDVTKTHHSPDFTLCDWEEGFNRHREELAGRTLGAHSYLAIDTVLSDGRLDAGSRSVLGRLVARNAPRPAILVPGRGTLSTSALDHLASSTLAIVNLQRVRGARTLDVIRSVLSRRNDRATLVIASSPSDLFALDFGELETEVPMHLIGKPPVLEQVLLSVVGRERLQEEQRFQFAVTELRGISAALDAILDLAEEAWWTTRQSLDAGNTQSTALPRFLRALEQFSRSAPLEAGLLTSARHLLEETAADSVHAAERREALLAQVEHHFRHPAGWSTAVVVRTPQEGEVIRQEMSDRWNTSPAELRQLGLEVKSIGAFPQRCDTVITSGYFGARTLDLILGSQARQAMMIVDPVEARVAFAHTARMRHILTHSGQGLSFEALERLAHPLSQVMAPGETVTKAVPLTPHISDLTITTSPSIIRPSSSTEDTNQPQLLLTFTDGTSFVCSPEFRFDVLDGRAGHLRQLPAAELTSGDEVIVVLEETQGLFSERLMQLLDTSALKAEAAKRLEWLLLVGSCALAHKRSTRSIHAGLQARGIEVDYATVRSWVPKPEAPAQGMTPGSWKHFQALAEELQILLPAEDLRRYYQAIRTWRITHRSNGRTLVRLMRYAVFGQLDASTLDLVARQWGFDTRELLQGTRLLTIDDIVAL
jgi:hypothetical protein